MTLKYKSIHARKYSLYYINTYIYIYLFIFLPFLSSGLHYVIMLKKTLYTFLHTHLSINIMLLIELAV